jgi:hypothetical protein
VGGASNVNQSKIGLCANAKIRVLQPRQAEQSRQKGTHIVSGIPAQELTFFL